MSPSPIRELSSAHRLWHACICTVCCSTASNPGNAAWSSCPSDIESMASLTDLPLRKLEVPHIPVCMSSDSKHYSWALSFCLASSVMIALQVWRFVHPPGSNGIKLSERMSWCNGLHPEKRRCCHQQVQVCQHCNILPAVEYMIAVHLFKYLSLFTIASCSLE